MNAHQAGRARMIKELNEDLELLKGADI